MLLLFLRASTKRKIGVVFLILLFLGSSLAYNLQFARATALTSSYNRITDSRPSITNVNYITGWTFPGTTAIGCMTIKYTTTASGSTKPTGMTTTSGTKVSVSGGGLTNGNWTLDAATDGTLKYTHATTEATSATAVIITTYGITNPSSAGVIYAQIKTYTNNDCSTGLTDYSTVAFAIAAGQALSVDVDPSLSFAIAGVADTETVNGVDITATTVTDANTIPLGSVNPTTNAVAAHDLTVSTNAINGYTIYASYSGTLTSTTGGYTIADWTGTNGAPTAFPAVGTSAFGYTTDDTTLSRFQSGGDKWAKFETWGYEVAKATTKVSAETDRIGFQVGASSTQEAGTYNTTIIYVATPTY